VTNAIDQVLRRAAEAGDIPGVVACVANDRDVIYEGAFGKRKLNADAPMTIDTVFRIASMTKAVTSVAAMQLIEQGKLQLDQPVASVIPAFGELQVLLGFYGDNPALRPPTCQATIRHLLTHTSGLGYEIWNTNLGTYQKVTKTPNISSGLKAAFRNPLVADPGSMWNYGINTDWLGYVVEEVSGQSLGSYMKRNIFEPLGMKDTSFNETDEQKTRMVTVHARQADGSLVPTDFSWPAGREFDNGGHGLVSTVRDYQAFVRMLLNEGTYNGSRVLQADIVAQMRQNHIGELLVTMMKTANPTLSNDAEFFPGMKKKHGLGFVINTEQWPGMRAAGSCAWAGLFNSFYWFDPTKRIAATIMMQLLPFADQKAMDVFTAFEKAVYASA
jgi:CubicO group peptidase (beta-lactamase class C family)